MRLRKTGTLRALCFDLENRPLAYWYDGETTSEITAFGWKWADEKHVNTMLLQPDGTFAFEPRPPYPAAVVDPRAAYDLFVGELSAAGIVYGHNIRRHDLPMLNAQLLRMELPPLAPMLTTDTCKDLPKRGGLSYSLENLAGMYGLKGAKYTMSQPMWEDANRLTESGKALARKRVASDVRLQEKLRAKLIALGILGTPRVWRP